MELINTTCFQFADIVGRINFPRHSLTLIVKGGFQLQANQKAVPLAEQPFPTGDEFAPQDQEQTGGIQYASDFAYFKPSADRLLVGKCHAPGGKALSQCDVTFQVGDQSRALRVFGERYWKHTIGRGAISEPVPFVEMPVNYENAFGGEGFEWNPVGKGITKGKLLPNIEDPNQLISSPGDQPNPAGFGPIQRMWGQRHSLLGTYTGDYLTTRWPWFPEDFDWRHFNAAPDEMQLPGYLAGDERLVFENLHPTYARYESQLPGLRLRCFKRTVDPQGQPPVFEEVEMNLDTLWVNMEDETLVLVWRGWTEVLSEEFEEISHIFVLSEPMEQPSVSVEQAHDMFKSKQAELAKQWAMAPETVEAYVAEAKESALEETVQNVAKQPSVEADALHAQVNKLLEQLKLDVKELPAATQQKLQEQQSKILQQLSATDPAQLAELEREELTTRLRTELAKHNLDLDNLPPLSEKAKQAQQRLMQELGLEEALIGNEELALLWEITAALLPQMGLDPEDLSPLIEHAKKQKQTIDKQLDMAPSIEEKPSLSKAEAELQSARIEAIKSRAQKRESFAGEDFSAMDLSGLDLQGLDFTGALFVGTNLQNTDLSGATLNEAKLIHANLTNAKLNQAQMSLADCTSADMSCIESIAATMSGAVIINAKMIGADLSECDLSAANLSDSDLSGSKFENANLTLVNASRTILDNANLFGADLSDAIFEQSQFTNAKLDQVTATDAIFVGANISGSRFVEAKLPGADFSTGRLNDTNFQGADLAEASLEKVSAQRINLSHANLEKLRASEASDFSAAILEQAQGKESIWHEAKLDGADFTFSKMAGADFSKASLTNARCYGADMRFARFRQADLASAQMLDMNLFKGSLDKANLAGTVFTGSNLYGVEFLEAHLEKTQLGGANVKATKLQQAV